MEDVYKVYTEVFNEWTDSLTADGGKQIKLKKYELQRAFPEMKKGFIDQMVKQKMMEVLEHKPMEQWPVSESVDPLLQQTKDQLVEVDARLEELQDQLDDAILSAQLNNERVQTGLKSLEEKTAEANSKRVLQDELEAKHSEVMSMMEGENVPLEKFEDHLQKQRLTVSGLNSCKAETDRELQNLEEDITRLRRECCARQKTISELTNDVAMKESENMKKEEEEREKSDWISNILTTVVNLTGNEVHQTADDTVTLQMKSLLNPSVSTKLTLKFENGSSKRTVSVSEMDCGDIGIAEVAQTVAANDPVDLLTAIQEMLNHHAPLIQEVNELRSQYAVDYLHDEGILRLMMGSKGQIICTLKIQPGYPHAGTVSLTALEGVQKVKSLDEYKPPVENTRLTDWVTYLQKEIETS